MANIFVSESYLGAHKPACTALDIRLVAFTFPPSYNSLESPVNNIVLDTKIPLIGKSFVFIDGLSASECREYTSVFSNNNYLEMINNLRTEDGTNDDIYLGHDNDVAGNRMASMLYYHLISHGVPSENIIRVPLLSVGYDWGEFIGGEFYSEEQLCAILEMHREQRYMMNVSPRTRIGYQILASLRHINNILKQTNHRVKRLNLFTSNVTYITKSSLSERT